MACWSSSGPAVPVSLLPSCFTIMTTGIVCASPSCFMSTVPDHLPVKSAPLRVQAAASSRLKIVLFIACSFFALLYLASLTQVAAEKLQLLFANRHHRVHPERPAGRQVAGDEGDSQKQQRHTRINDGIGGADMKQERL